MISLVFATATGLVRPPCYDYVIVGGGTAGSVLANRLSADQSKQVLVLEPGPSPRGSVKVAAPVALTKLFFSKWDWSFESTPTEGTANRPIHLCRGKCLGGSSATNALLYHRGTREDFDSWDLEAGVARRCCRASLAVEGQHHLSNAKYHNADGPVGVESARYRNPLSDRFLEAAEQANHPRNPDFNDWDRPQEGVGQFQPHATRQAGACRGDPPASGDAPP